MMTLADASIGLDELTDKLGARPQGPTPQEGTALIDQWIGPLQEVESTQPIAATLIQLKGLLDQADPQAQQQTLQTLSEQISELGLKMGVEGEIPSLLEALSAVLRQSGELSKADSAA